MCIYRLIQCVVNPDHLFLGTPQDNIDDMFNKGRRRRLIRNPRFNNLTYSKAQDIRQYAMENPTMKQYQIADHFNISKQQCSRVLRYDIWKEAL